MPVNIISDIIFAHVLNSVGEPEALQLDLYLPASAEPGRRPAILWLHGGAFRPGNDKRQSYIVRLATEFAGRGYASVAADYRVRADPTAGWPAALRDAMADVRLALDWLRANAATYGVDTSRIILAGGSAGGMIVHNLCHDPAAPLDAVRDGVRAAISLWGPPFPEARLFAAVNPHCPPTLLIHGTADALVPYHLSQTLADELRTAGVTCELLTLPDAPHTPLMHMAQIIATIAEFLDNLG